MREWHLVLLVGYVFGYGTRAIWDWLRRSKQGAQVYKGRWPAVLLALVLGQGCTPVVAFGVGLRVAGATAATAHAVNQARKAGEPAEPEDEQSVAVQQKRARAKAEVDLAAFRARRR